MRDRLNSDDMIVTQLADLSFTTTTDHLDYNGLWDWWVFPCARVNCNPWRRNPWLHVIGGRKKLW